MAPSFWATWAKRAAGARLRRGWLGTVAVLGFLATLITLAIHSALSLLDNGRPAIYDRNERLNGNPTASDGREGPKGYLYAYPHSASRRRFAMLSLGKRTHAACPGGLLSPPYVTSEGGGRLGNFILEYASTWAVAREFKLPGFISDRLHRRLKEVFDDLSLPPVSEVLARDRDCMQAKELPFSRKGLTRVDLTNVTLNGAVKMARATRAFVVLDHAADFPEAVVPHAAHLRKELRFRPQLQRVAQAELRRLRWKHFPKFQGEVVYAAVHVRRTDYDDHLTLLYNVSQPVSIDYYLSAAAWLRHSLPADKALLFVVTSDNRDWVEILIPALTAAGAGAGWAAAWAGSGDIHRPDRDLALLSACNHTIFSYGTFGTAAALLAGGRATVYQLAPTPNHPTLLSVAEQYARNIPGWVTMR